MTFSGLGLYRGGATLLSPFARVFLEARARRGKEDAARIGERLGRPATARPAGALIWLHGASIGEGLALLPLVARLRERGLAILVTTGTPASAQVLRDRLPPGALHQFAPLDLPAAIRAFLDHWRPQALLLAESELWPNMLGECATRKIPVGLVNARVSERSYARWRRAPGAARTLLGGLSACLAQSPEHARRLADLGARDVIVAGNLKHDGVAPPADPIELARLRAMTGARPVLLAASTHDGEEALLLRAFVSLRATAPDLLLILAPRDTSRAGAICALARRSALTVATRASGARIAAETAVLIADTVGEMGLWLRLASIVVIGRTFARTLGEAGVDGGGQTPIEAARSGAAILHGPSVSNFADVFEALDSDRGALAIDETSLAGSVAALLADPARRRAMARNAANTVDRLSGATTRTMAALEPMFARALAMEGSRA